jgi:S1-C subfamily serine protease
MVFSSNGVIAAAVEPDIRRDATVIATEKVMPCVVNIATENIIEYHDWYEDLLRQFYGWRAPGRRQRSLSLGSGVIIDEDGYILTNSHVVRPATRIQVKLWDGREYEADPLWFTQDSDLALLKIRAKPGEKFRAIKFAPDDDLLLGETVIALGDPFGLGGSVSRGILSSKNRRPATGNEPLNVEDWLQTDAAINPGNSGGPLVNMHGELIGINVAVYRETTGERGPGVSFSIPVKQVSATLSRFSTPEHTDGLWLGLQAKPAGAVRRATDRPAGEPAPGTLVVASVQPGSPAAKAGIQEGDQVLQVNGETPANLIAFNRLLCASNNLEAHLVIAHAGERRSVSVNLVPFKDVIPQRLGVTFTEPPEQALTGLNLNPKETLLFGSVEKNGPADNAKLERGFLLLGIDDQRISGLKTVGEVLSGKKPGDTVQLTVVAPRRLGAGYLEFRQGTVEVKVR